MEEHRDIYAKPEPKPGDQEPLPAYEQTPDEHRQSNRRRSIWSFSIMAVLLLAVAAYFYTQEKKFRLDPLLELLNRPKRGTGTVERVASTNAQGIQGLGAGYNPAGGQQPPVDLPPQKLADAVGKLRLAHQQMMARDWDAAERLAKEALGIWDGMNAAQRMLGVIYLQRGQFDQSVLMLERALQTDPFSTETLVNLATASMQRGQLERAEDLLLTALQLMPESFTSQVNLGLLYLLWARYDQSAEHFEEALKIMPDNTGVRNNLGVSLLRIGRYEEARKHFDYIVRMLPDRPEAYFNMAIVYTLERNNDEAMAWIRRALERTTPAAAQRHLTDSDFNALRALPAFQALMRELSEPAARSFAPSPPPE